MIEAADDFIDLERVEKLKAMMGEHYPLLVGNCLQNTSGYIAEMQRALATENRASTLEIAHKMTSSCGQFGLVELQRRAKAIEHSTEETSQLIEQCEELATALAHAKAFLVQHNLA